MEEHKYFISVVIPVFNEAGSIRELVDRLLAVLKPMGSHEVIFINDGSTDDTENLLNSVQKEHSSIIKVFHLRQNCGKSIALQKGFGKATGEYVVMMDGDLQDIPEEIPKLIEALEKNNLDAVTGWRFHRKDPILKTFPSKGFNIILRWLSGLNIHDFNCGFKAFRRKCLEHFSLYGQLHRFILVFIAYYGFKVGEVKLEHSPRRFGISKYGFKRMYYGFMDILTVFFITRYLESPLYFFGKYGLITIFISLPIGIYFLVMHFLSFAVNNPRMRLAEHPIWVISPVLFLLGFIMIFFGLIGELLTYHLLSKNKNSIFEKTGSELRKKEEDADQK
jgi:glycosyltransferase involved in cell wall biosynthesis